ncbi:unnamed protein product [Effrenium voratum]|uniref:Sugar phosphate transporter domain-containing protein n=1 Tax=Effrenium voratum TaxID=2562239 RepID=A0AA36JT00_9DINO|nr:unnamed protein product [Effrenium voratum]|eukprot:CAMPEP_0181479600 /NCGR_PEP_ID=MMETSP1110-20121109/43367_1 /TAXON_ID=174948 /ORGANISM="Symbiodinium sp., Strain CCMP421" /LENGTH=453 /DNA_ID=CAMNT_0023605041 /DNA_START=66 /DNA_END=1427 /DNA_ORIENTATION=+
MRVLALFLPLCLADTAVPVETASLLELDQRRSKRAVRREGDPVEEVRGSNASWSLHGTFRQSLVGAYLLAESPQLELLLEETETKAPGDAVMEEKSWRAVYILTVLIFIAISPIGFNEGLKPFCTVVVYLACLSLVKMWVKETMNNGFPYPDTITAVHMLCTSLVAGFFERPRLSEAWVVLPISVVNGASLLSNNTAMLYGGVAFVSMVASCTPMFTFSLELLKGKRTLDLLTVLSVILVCSGSIFCVRGEKTASLLALCFAAGGSLMRAMKGVWQHDLLSISVTPMRLTFWSGFWSFWITSTMVMFNEGTEAFKHFGSTSQEAKTSLVLSIFAAVALNVSQCFAVKQLGALLQSIVGNLNLILVIVLSQAWLHEQVTIWQFVGVFLLAMGTFASKAKDLKKKTKKEDEKVPAPAQADETTKLPEPNAGYGAVKETEAEATNDTEQAPETNSK